MKGVPFNAISVPGGVVEEPGMRPAPAALPAPPPGALCCPRSAAAAFTSPAALLLLPLLLPLLLLPPPRLFFLRFAPLLASAGLMSEI